jgi:hypothetical protein
MPHRHRQVAPESLPVREELDALARRYHHGRNEHQRASPDSALRRQLQEEMLEVRGRFERVLEEWVPGPELREAWLEYLKNRTAEPEGPPAIEPLAFKGMHDASGSIAEVRGRDDDAQVWVDGALVERVVAQKDFTQEVSPAVFRADGMDFAELFDASPEALSALDAYRRDGGEPPWQYASELLADGLIDVHFELTPRGRRALAQL